METIFHEKVRHERRLRSWSCWCCMSREIPAEAPLVLCHRLNKFTKPTSPCHLHAARGKPLRTTCTQRYAPRYPLPVISWHLHCTHPLRCLRRAHLLSGLTAFAQLGHGAVCCWTPCAEVRSHASAASIMSVRAPTSARMAHPHFSLASHSTLHPPLCLIVCTSDPPPLRRLVLHCGGPCRACAPAGRERGAGHGGGGHAHHRVPRLHERMCRH